MDSFCDLARAMELCRTDARSEAVSFLELLTRTQAVIAESQALIARSNALLQRSALRCASALECRNRLPGNDSDGWTGQGESTEG
jgi:hypothetical protein